jgi:phosphatidylinositol kinase/protein kinase (PI-3  family)
MLKNAKQQNPHRKVHRLIRQTLTALLDLLLLVSHRPSQLLGQKARLLPNLKSKGTHLQVRVVLLSPTNWCIGQTQTQTVGSPSTSQPQQPRKPWEYVEEILRTLRTAYPLLVVSMEGIVDSINTRFKCPWDEDSYRLIVALLNDGISVYVR